MKTTKCQSIVAVMAATGLLWSAGTVLAQDSPTGNPAQSAAASTSVPQLSHGVPQVLQLKQAEVKDDTIIAYIQNSGNSYALNADQIIYLRQQGVSDAVITAMLQQPKPMNSVAATAEPAPQSVASTDQPVATTTAAPSVTYVQAAPAPVYYYQPYYYPVYGVYPAVSLSFGWGWHGGGYYGGWHGGWHR